MIFLDPVIFLEIFFLTPLNRLYLVCNTKSNINYNNSIGGNKDPAQAKTSMRKQWKKVRVIWYYVHNDQPYERITLISSKQLRSGRSHYALWQT